MKNILKLITVTLMFSTFSYAVTPFSLEGLKDINLVVADKGKVLSKETLLKIKNDATKKLQEMGIKTKSNSFRNIVIKIDAIEVSSKFAVNVHFFIVESVNPLRDKELENVAITYSQNDFFIADSLEDEVYESAIEFLLYSFEEQYIEEN